MWFNEYKSYVTNDGEKPLTPIMGLLGGMSAGCFSTLGNNPFDVVKVRFRRYKERVSIFCSKGMYAVDVTLTLLYLFVSARANSFGFHPISLKNTTPHTDKNARH